MGKRKIKYNIGIWCIIILLGIMNVTSCQSKESNSTAVDKKTEKDQEPAEKEQKKDREIPAELFPGAEDASTVGIEDAQDMQIVQDDGTVYAGNESESAGNTVSESETKEPSQSKADKITISFDVESSKAEAYGYAVYYSAQLTVKSGATVYDALAASGVDYSGKSYISSIGGLPEKTGTGTAGWKYFVNGKEPGVSCANYTLKDGDAVQWSYVLKP